MIRRASILLFCAASGKRDGKCWMGLIWEGGWQGGVGVATGREQLSR